MSQRASRLASRRRFLGACSAATFAAAAPAFLGDLCYGADARLDRRRMGLIGAGSQGFHLVKKALAFADLVAVADVHRPMAERAAAEVEPRPRIFEDYRQLLD